MNDDLNKRSTHSLSRFLHTYLARTLCTKSVKQNFHVIKNHISFEQLWVTAKWTTFTATPQLRCIAVHLITDCVIQKQLFVITIKSPLWFPV